MVDINLILEYYMETYGSNQEYMLNYFNDDQNVVPIYQRESASPLKESTHTNVHINYFEDIISRKVGYAGQDIEFVDSSDTYQEELDKMLLETNAIVCNSETMALTSIQGISHRLCYTEDGVFKTKNLEGQSVVYEWDNDIFNPERAYYFYRETGMDGSYIDKCNVYDKKMVTYWFKDEAKKNATNNQTQEGKYIPYGEEQPHNFNQVPIIPFMNNSGWKSDCWDTTKLMDVYDEVISDTAGELKAARLAYLKIWGDLHTGDDRYGNEIPIPNYLQQFGTMIFGTDDLGNQMGDAQFLEKKLDDTAIQNMLKDLRSHIYELSGSIDLKQLTDASSARVFTIKAALLRLENTSKVTENYMKQGFRKQMKLWAYWMSEFSNLAINVDDIEIKFNRSFITDDKEKSEVLALLLNTMSKVDAYTEAGYKNPAALAERFEEEIGNLDYAEVKLDVVEDVEE